MSETETSEEKSSSSSCAENVFIAVHAGAGNHSDANEYLYKSVCKRACQQAMLLLQSKASALEAVTAAVAALEDDSCTNAGRGSNLTFHGTVECDACVMDGKSLLFGAVGALSGVSNPVSVARQLVEEQQLGPLPCGRVRPSILVGNGAQIYCSDKGFDVKSDLISENSFKTYNRYKRKCQRAELAASSPKRQKLGNEELDSQESEQTPQPSADSSNDWSQEDPTGVQDTVGAVCVDHEGNVASATSSGGIWLKHPGRLGPAAIYGSGCWAQNQISNSRPGIACVTSGCGEHLIQTVLAKTCSDVVRGSQDMTQALTTVFTDSFLGSEFLTSKSAKYGGALILRMLKSDSSKEVELAWIHSTASMCLAYMSGRRKTPTATMSRLETRCTPGQTFTMGGHIELL